MQLRLTDFLFEVLVYSPYFSTLAANTKYAKLPDPCEASTASAKESDTGVDLKARVGVCFVEGS